MQKQVVSRLLQTVVTFLLLSVGMFFLLRTTGNPVDLMLPVDATKADREQLQKALGLDRPLYVQYGIFVSSAVKGDFGTSLRAGRPVKDLIAERLPNSIKLAFAAILVALFVAIPLGVLAAVKKGTHLDTAAKAIALMGQAMPAFWVGIMLIELVSVRMKLLPVTGSTGLANYVLPAITLGLFIVAGIMRLLRSSMLEVLDSEFVKLARAKGVSERVIIWKHALRNALMPVVTFAAIYFAFMVTMAVVVEVVFAWPGMGRLAYEGIMYRDFPVTQGVVLVAAGIVLAVNLVVDISYVYIDPRIRY